VLVDLSDVSYCDSTGINALLAAYLRATARHIDMVVTGAAPPVRRVFEMAGVDDLLARDPDVAAD
jgi:anti-sigma B factor antagonist